ncbi:anti-sigma factor [Paracoccus tegillarcae]|nr:hypothetical protein [Paracoccus tegillarcae]
MNDTPQPSDETLMAYADGMLDGDEMRIVETAIRQDPALAARVDSFRETARRVGQLGKAQDDHVPDALIARVRELAAQSQAEAAPAASPAAPVVDFASRRQQADPRPAARSAPIWQLPLAASIFLALGLWGGMKIGPNLDDQPDAAQLALLDSPGVHQVLNSARSGEQAPLDGGGEVSLIASFNNAEGQLCREFEIVWPQRPTIVSVSCRAPQTDADGWAAQLAVLASVGDDQNYAPASSLETLDTYVGAIGASQPLSPEEEAAALQALN